MKNYRPNRFVITALSLFLFSLVTLFCQSGKALTESSLSAILAPITVTKSTPTLTTDVNGNGTINPGDTLTYSITVANGATDATGVIFTDVLNSNLTLVAGSVNSSPIARNESFSVLGNVSITIPDGASDVLANDADPDGTTPMISGYGNSLANANATPSGTATTTANGGNVTLQSNGGFTYNPPAGFEGTDSFFYTLRDAGADGVAGNADDATNTAQVTLNVSGMIWFVNNSSAACTSRALGCGRLSNPYSSSAAFQAENNGTGNNPASGDNIFIYTGSGDYDASVTLLNNQKLIGQGANTALTGAGSITALTPPSFSATLPTTGGTNPTLITTAGAANAINLGQNNTLRGVTIGNTTGAKLNAAATIGTATIGSPSGASDVTLNGNGQAVSLTGGGILAARFASISTTNANQVATTTGITLTSMGGSLVSTTTTITNPNGIGINIGSSASGANFDFGNTTLNQSGNTGVSLTSNAGTITFADLDIAPDSGQRGLQATNNTGAITTTSGTFSTTNGTAVDITGVSAASKTPLNITLTSVSVSGIASGIMLTNTSSTGSPGGFKIVGNASTAASGGTISNISGADGSTTSGIGVYLDNVSDITLQNMTFSGTFGNFGVRGQNVTNFTLRDSSFTGIFGSNATDNEETIRFGTENFTTGIKGTALFEGNTIGGGWENNLSVYLYGSDTLSMTVQDSANDQAIFNDQGSSFGNDALFVESGGTGSNLTLLVNGVRFNGAQGDQLQVGQIGVTTQTFTITNNEFLNTSPNIVSGGGGLTILGGSTASTSNATVTYTLSGNIIKGAQGDAVKAIYTGYAATISGLILNNTIGTPNGVFEENTNGGSTNGGEGINVGHAKGVASGGNNGTINQAVRIEGNNVRDIKNGLSGIRVTNGSKVGGTSRLEATVKNNTVADSGPDLLSGFYAIVGASGSGDISQTGLVITGNSFTAGSGNGGGSAIFLDFFQNSNANYYIPGYPVNANSSHGEYAPNGGGGTASSSLEAFWVPLNVALNQGPFPTPPASKVDALQTKNITNNAFVLAVPALASLAVSREDTNLATVTYDELPNFKNSSYPSLLEMPAMPASIEPFVKHSVGAEAVSSVEIVNARTTVQGTETVLQLETIETQEQSYWRKVSTFVSSASVVLGEFAETLGSAISPTVNAQEDRPDTEKKRTKPDLLAAPEVGETVCVDGNTDPNNCTGGFSIPANESTTITFRAVVNAASTAASIPNTANVTATGGINQNSNTVTTTVVQPPSVAKSFGASFIAVGGTTSLNFTVTNPNPSTVLTGVAVTDVLPAGLSVVNSTTSVCGGTNNLVTTAANRTIALSATTIAAGGNCQFSVTVTGVSEGLQNNLSGNVTSTNGGQGNTASASITVINPPTLAKSFTPNQIQLNATSGLQFTLTNPNTTLVLNTLAFTDSLPSGVTAPNTAATTVCTDGSYSITNNVISVTKPSLAGATNCVFSVTVTGTTVGLKTNLTSTVTTANSNPGAAAMANLTVVAPPTIGKVFAPTSIVAGSNSTVTLTLSNSNTTGALTDASFTDTLVNMSAAGGAVTGNCAASPNTLAAGATALNFSGIIIPNNGSCTVIFSVTSSTVGVQPNTTSGVTTMQTSVAGTVSNTANLTVVAAATPPTVTAATGITRSQGNLVASSNSQIATVNDADQTENTLVVTVNGGTTATAGGVTVSNIAVDAMGNVTANVVADATATTANFTLRVTDAQGAFTETMLTVTVVVGGFEADVAPRPNGDGNGRVNGGDVTQVQRFVVGLDKPFQSNEFQRADSAPRADTANDADTDPDLGNGAINGGDVTQAQRYSVNLDGGTTAAGGPTGPPMMIASEQITDAQTKNGIAAPEADVYTVTAVRQSLTATTITVAIQLDTDAGSMGAASVSGTLRFVTTEIGTPTNIRLGSGAPAGTSFFVNDTDTANGRLGFTINAPVNQTFAVGQQQLLLVDFTIVGSGSTVLSFDDSQAQRFVGDVNGNQFTAATFPSNTVSLSQTTAAVAGISGRVRTAKGGGFAGVEVTLQETATGERHTTVTDEAGNYRFDNLPVGADYVITPQIAGFSFSPNSKHVSLFEELTETDFTAISQKRKRQSIP